jgi:DNA-binding PadR family transcriptional regulator
MRSIYLLTLTGNGQALRPFPQTLEIPERSIISSVGMLRSKPNRKKGPSWDVTFSTSTLGQGRPVGVVATPGATSFLKKPIRAVPYLTLEKWHIRWAYLARRCINMRIPDLSALQFLVIRALGGKERPGKEIRGKIAEYDHRMSKPAFYQLMARLEEAGFVKGVYHLVEIAGQVAKERHYKVTAKGLEAYNATTRFFQPDRLGSEKVVPNA